MTDGKEDKKAAQTRKLDVVRYEGPLLSLLQNKLPVYKDLIYVEPWHACMPAKYVEYHSKFSAFKSKSSDVWVASFPKSGTTWCQELAWVTYWGTKHPDASKLLTARAPFFEWDCLFPEGYELDNLPDGDLNKTNVMWNLLQDMPPPRFIKTHLHHCLLPPGVTQLDSKVIYVCRDPKDVCVSLFYHSLKLEGYTGSFGELVDLFLADVHPWAPYWVNVLGFWKIRNDPNVLFLTYEDMKKDLRGIIQKVAQFLEVQREGLPVGRLSEAELDEITQHCTFAAMAKNPATNNEALFASAAVAKDNNNFGNFKFMRKGQVGDHKQHLSVEQLQRFKQWTEKWLKDSDFPYYRD